METFIVVERHIIKRKDLEGTRDYIHNMNSFKSIKDARDYLINNTKKHVLDWEELSDNVYDHGFKRDIFYKNEYASKVIQYRMTSVIFDEES